MKVFITGSSGFIGRNLVNRLQLSGHTLYLHKRDDSLWDIHRINPDIIYHIAGEVRDESKMFNSNLELTHRLLEITKDIDYKAFIHIGSSSEYGRKQSPFKETDNLVPTNIYEATKAGATLLCQAYGKEFDKPIVTVRVFSIYGDYEPEYRLIPTVYTSMKENKKINIVNSAVHDFTYIDDLIDFLEILPEKSDIISGDIINFGTGFQTSNIELVKIFERVFKTELNYEIIKTETSIRKPYDTTTWVCDTNYLNYKYKFSTKYNLEQGILKYGSFREATKKNI